MTTIDGEELTSTKDVIAYLEPSSVSGDTVTLTSAESGGAHRDIRVTLGSRTSVADLETAPPH